MKDYSKHCLVLGFVCLISIPLRIDIVYPRSVAFYPLVRSTYNILQSSYCLTTKARTKLCEQSSVAQFRCSQANKYIFKMRMFSKPKCNLAIGLSKYSMALWFHDGAGSDENRISNPIMFHIETKDFYIGNKF